MIMLYNLYYIHTYILNARAHARCN